MTTHTFAFLSQEGLSIHFIFFIYFFSPHTANNIFYSIASPTKLTVTQTFLDYCVVINTLFSMFI